MDRSAPACALDGADSGPRGPAAAHSELLQSDYANLKRLQIVLEAAKADMKAAHASRIARYIK